MAGDVFDLLSREVGGVIVIICEPESLKESVEFSNLDGCALRKVVETLGKDFKNVNKAQLFLSLLRAVRSHSISDRWEMSDVKKLSLELGMDEDGSVVLAPLVDQPMDGAFFLSPNGTIVGAAERLECRGRRKLLHSNGTHMGTKHQSALAAADSIVKHAVVPAAVLVASDSGSLTMMLVNGKHSQMEILQVVPEGSSARRQSSRSRPPPTQMNADVESGSPRKR